jgi:hypothetical protein
MEGTNVDAKAAVKFETADKRMTTRAKMHVTFMKHTIGKVSERKSDHYGTTSRHDKKDRQKETKTSKEEETEKTEEIRLLPIAKISYFSFFDVHFRFLQ